MAGGRYYSRDNVAAVTLGTSTNAVNVEATQDVPKWSHQNPASGDELVITDPFTMHWFKVIQCLINEQSNKNQRIED